MTCPRPHISGRAKTGIKCNTCLRSLGNLIHAHENPTEDRESMISEAVHSITEQESSAELPPKYININLPFQQLAS